MFKALNTAWNAHTPDYLHPYTKENMIWQLKLTAVLAVGIITYEVVTERYKRRKFLKNVEELEKKTV